MNQIRAAVPAIGIAGASSVTGFIVSIIDQVPVGAIVGAFVFVLGLVIKQAMWQQRVTDQLEQLLKNDKHIEENQSKLWEHLDDLPCKSAVCNLKFVPKQARA